MRSLLVVQQSQRMLICYLVCPKSAKHAGIGTRFHQIIPRNNQIPHETASRRTPRLWGGTNKLAIFGYQSYLHI